MTTNPWWQVQKRETKEAQDLRKSAEELRIAAMQKMDARDPDDPYALQARQAAAEAEGTNLFQTRGVLREPTKPLRSVIPTLNVFSEIGLSIGELAARKAGHGQVISQTESRKSDLMKDALIGNKMVSEEEEGELFGINTPASILEGLNVLSETHETRPLSKQLMAAAFDPTLVLPVVGFGKASFGATAAMRRIAAKETFKDWTERTINVVSTGQRIIKEPITTQNGIIIQMPQFGGLFTGINRALDPQTFAQGNNKAHNIGHIKPSDEFIYGADPYYRDRITIPDDPNIGNVDTIEVYFDEIEKSWLVYPKDIVGKDLGYSFFGSKKEAINFAKSEHESLGTEIRIFSKKGFYTDEGPQQVIPANRELQNLRRQGVSEDVRMLSNANHDIYQLIDEYLSMNRWTMNDDDKRALIAKLRSYYDGDNAFLPSDNLPIILENAQENGFTFFGRRFKTLDEAIAATDIEAELEAIGPILDSFVADRNNIIGDIAANQLDRKLRDVLGSVSPRMMRHNITMESLHRQIPHIIEWAEQTTDLTRLSSRMHVGPMGGKWGQDLLKAADKPTESLWLQANRQYGDIQYLLRGIFDKLGEKGRLHISTAAGPPSPFSFKVGDIINLGDEEIGHATRIVKIDTRNRVVVMEQVAVGDGESISQLDRWMRDPTLPEDTSVRGLRMGAEQVGYGRFERPFDWFTDAYRQDPTKGLRGLAQENYTVGEWANMSKADMDKSPIRLADVNSMVGQPTPRYMIHRPPSRLTEAGEQEALLTAAPDGGIQSYPIAMDQPSEGMTIAGKFKEGVDQKIIWMGSAGDNLDNIPDNVWVIDTTKVDPLNVTLEGSGWIHAGNIPVEAVVRKPSNIKSPVVSSAQDIAFPGATGGRHVSSNLDYLGDVTENIDPKLLDDTGMAVVDTDAIIAHNLELLEDARRKGKVVDGTADEVLNSIPDVNTEIITTEEAFEQLKLEYMNLEENILRWEANLDDLNTWDSIPGPRYLNGLTNQEKIAFLQATREEGRLIPYDYDIRRADVWDNIFTKGQYWNPKDTRVDIIDRSNKGMRDEWFDLRYSRDYLNPSTQWEYNKKKLISAIAQGKKESKKLGDKMIVVENQLDKEAMDVLGRNQNPNIKIVSDPQTAKQVQEIVSQYDYKTLRGFNGAIDALTRSAKEVTKTGQEDINVIVNTIAVLREKRNEFLVHVAGTIPPGHPLERIFFGISADNKQVKGLLELVDDIDVITDQIEDIRLLDSEDMRFGSAARAELETQVKITGQRPIGKKAIIERLRKDRTKLKNQVRELEKTLDDYVDVMTKGKAGDNFTIRLGAIPDDTTEVTPEMQKAHQETILHAQSEMFGRNLKNRQAHVNMIDLELQGSSQNNNFKQVPYNHAEAKQILNEYFAPLPGHELSEAAALFRNETHDLTPISAILDDFINKLPTDYRVASDFDVNMLANVDSQFMSPTYLTQAMDLGHFGGAIQKNILWTQRSVHMTADIWQDILVARIHKILERTTNTKKVRQATTDVMEQINADRLSDTLSRADPVETLLLEDDIKAVFARKENKKLTDSDKFQAVQLALDMRRVFDELLVSLNKSRSKQGKDMIPKRDNYVPWIRESSVWSGHVIGLDDIKIRTNDPLPPSFIKNEYDNPRALPRDEGLNNVRRERDIWELTKMYLTSARKDIFNSLIISNTKPYIKKMRAAEGTMIKDFDGVMREATFERSATALENWVYEAYGSKMPALSAAIRNNIPGGATAANFAMRVRRNLTRAVFPFNHKWSFIVQPSSIALTVKNYGIETLGAIPDLFLKENRDWVIKNAYSAWIKRRGGRFMHQDLHMGANTIQNAQRTYFESATDVGNLLINTIENWLTMLSVQAAKRTGTKKGLTGDALINFASDGGAKTQSMYNFEDAPAVLRNREIGAMFPFQTFAIEAFNQMREMIGPIMRGPLKESKFTGASGRISGQVGTYAMERMERSSQFIRFLGAVIVINMVSDKLTGRYPWQFTSALPFSTILQSLIESQNEWNQPLLIKAGVELFNSMDAVVKHNNWLPAKELILNYGGISGGTSINRLIDGTIAWAREEKQSVSGNKLFEVDDSNTELFKILSQGIYSTEGGKEYIDELNRTRGGNVYKATGIKFSEDYRFWEKPPVKSIPYSPGMQKSTKKSRQNRVPSTPIVEVDSSNN